MTPSRVREDSAQREQPFAPIAQKLAAASASSQAWNRALEQARDFAHLAGAQVEEWMVWVGWCLHVGCDTCAEQGHAAECWGTKGCHGYLNGCGCTDCAAQQTRDAAAAAGGMETGS